MSQETAGILLGQLGTPDAPTPEALRRYLREFLGDPRILELPPLKRRLLLELIILPRRSKESAELYRRIWTEAGSPLLVTTERQRDLLAEALGGDVPVAAGMRYGRPSIEEGLSQLEAAGVKRLLLFPLFPQYSATTTASLHDALFDALKKRRFIPALRVVPPYPDHPAYLDALEQVAREALEKIEPPPEVFVFSFHGIPLRYAEAGDPYPEECKRTAEALAERLGLEPERRYLAYQSRFGREPWLQPYTDELLDRLAREGIRRVAVICPGFVSDCLETIDEIGHVARERFLALGGEALHLIPCLNDHPAWIAAMARIAREELTGWLPCAAESAAGGAGSGRHRPTPGGTRSHGKPPQERPQAR